MDAIKARLEIAKTVMERQEKSVVTIEVIKLRCKNTLQLSANYYLFLELG